MNTVQSFLRAVSRRPVIRAARVATAAVLDVARQSLAFTLSAMLIVGQPFFLTTRLHAQTSDPTPPTYSPTLTTDKGDYAPTTWVQLTGRGFKPNEIVTFQVVHIVGENEPDPGDLPWDVQADENGHVSAVWYVPWDAYLDTMLATAYGNESKALASATFTDGPTPTSDLEGWNKTTWTNNAGSSSLWAEGQTVPIRFTATNLLASVTYTAILKYDYSNGTKRFFDYLTDYNATLTPGTLPSGSEAQLSIPLDPDVTASHTQRPGFFRLYNAGSPSIAASYTLTSGVKEIRVSFTVTDPAQPVVILYGAHLASGAAAPAGWGTGNGASSSSGGSGKAYGKLSTEGGDSNFSLNTSNVSLDKAPVASNGTETTPEDTAKLITLVATDADGDPLTYTITGGPSHGSLVLSSGSTYLYTPTANYNGPDSFTFQANDGTLGSNIATVSITVSSVNDAPVLAGVPASATTPELSPYTFTATATDVDVPAQTLTFSLTGSPPAGASIGSSSGVFTWTPTEAQGPNSYTFNVSVSDGVTSTTQSITINVNEVNSAPVLTSPGNKTVNEGNNLSFTLSATDSDVPPNTLTYSISSGLQTGMTLTGNSFSWTPTPAQGPNTYSVTFKVTDNGTPVMSDEKTITITVGEVNTAPVLASPGNQTINELATLSFNLSATDSDVPANTLTYSILSGGLAGMTLTGNSFSWTPSEGQGPGSYSVTFKVTDNGTPALSDEKTITITVNEVNVAPVLSNVPASATIPELSLYTFTATATDVDIPAQTLTFSLVGAPAGALIGGASGVFTWTPTEGQGPGTYPFTVSVSDGVATTSQSITLTVTEANAAPVLSNVPASATIPELSPYTFTATATDADVPAQTLTFSLVSGPAGASIDPSTGVFTWTPTETQGPGAYPFSVSVSDGVTSTSQAITLTVAEVNSAPALADPGNKTINEQALLSFTLSATDSDIPANTLSYSIASGGQTGMSLDPVTGAFTWTPTEAQGPNTYSVTFRVTDNGTPALSDEKTITITVNEVNTAPKVDAIPDATIPELVPYSFTALATDDDNIGQTLTFSLVGAPTGATIGANSGVFDWTPTEEQGPAVYEFAVRVSDGVVAVDMPVKITVTEVNIAPVLANVPASATIPELSPYTFTATATDADVPLQTLTFSVVGGPAGASIDPSTGVFTWTPSETQGPGTYPFSVSVSDGVTSTSQSITLTVTEVNAAPVLANVPAAPTIPELVPYSFTATATDADTPAQTLTFSVVGAPAGASIDPSTGVFTWTPTELQGPGTYPFTVSVSDGVTSTSQSITITVNEVNVAPVLANVPASATIPELVPYSFTATATDADNPTQTLTFSLIGAPAGASIDPSTGAFTWTPAETQGPGTYPFTVSVSDGVTSTSQSITLTVSEVNAAPVLANVPATVTIPELSPYTFTATATDVDAPAQLLTFSLVGAPAGASIGGASGVFTWTPAEGQGPGIYPFTVSVSDGVTSTSQSITITVTEVNVAPVLANVPATATIPELLPYTFTATATDADIPTQTLTFSLVGAPAGASIDPATGVFTWTPTETQGPDTYPFTVSVSDGVTSTTQSITITVTEVNDAPVLANVPTAATIPEMVPYSFTATATDADAPAQTLTFSLVGAPAGASIDPSTGVFSWTPTEAQGPGTYPFSVSVSDGVTSTSQAITLTVSEVNVAPVLADPGPKSIDEESLLSFTLSATDSDFPANTLSYSISSGGLPGMSLDPVTGAFTWTPTEAQGPDTYSVTFKVTDNGTPALSDEKTITITVNEVNKAPKLDPIPDATIPEMVPYSFTALATDDDSIGQTLTFSLVGGPIGATIGANSGVFDWTPTEEQGPGVYEFAVRVSDGVVAVDMPVKITVTEVNIAPVLANVPASATIPELSPYTFTATATDADVPLQTLTFSLIGAPTGASIDPSTGVFTWTPSEAQGPGSYPFTVSVSDGVTSATKSITLTVTEVNAAPVLANVPAAQTIPELVPYSFTATATDDDVPTQTLTFSLIGGPAGASIGSSSGVFSWTPAENQGPGSYTFKVSVSDGVTSTEQSITLTVSEVNVAPVITVPGPQVVNELAALNFSVSATDSDLPANTLTFSMANSPAGMTINPTTGAVSWTPGEAQDGIYTVTFIVTDNGSPALSNQKTVQITVNEVNVAPVLANVPASATIPELVPYSFTATATDADVPVQTLTFSLIDGPAGASIGSSSGMFSWTPAENQGPGSYTFKVSVSDGVTSAEQSVTLTVSEVNVAPVITVPGAQVVNEAAPLNFSVSATDADLPANTLTFSMTNSPAGMTINPSTGTVSWTPTEAQGPGVYTVTFIVTDNGSPALSDQNTVQITVNEVNNKPVLDDPGNKTVDEETLVSFTLTANDPDIPADTLAFSISSGLQAGMALNPATGAFTWTPTEAQGPNTYTVTFRVTDLGGLYDEKSITITVNEVNKAPKLDPVPDATIDELVPYSFTALASDDDNIGQTLTFSIIGGPAGATIGASTGVFNWTPAEDQGPAVYNFSIRVSDGVAAVDVPVKITVREVNVAPVITVPGAQTVNELATLNFSVSATDADLPANTLTFSMANAPAGLTINPSTGAVSWTPGEAQDGIYTVTFIVTDNGSPALSNQKTVQITVNEVNVAPVLANVPASATIPELVAYSFTATASDNDAPAQTLTFSLIGGPAGASIGSSSGVFSWTPAENQGPGSYTFKVSVSDGVASTEQSITLTVSEVNVAPVITVPTARTVNELATLTFSVSATDADLPANTLTFSMANAPAGMTINPSTGAVSWTPTEGQDGVYTVTFIVTDNGSPALSDQKTVQVTVNEVNVAPVITVPTARTVDELATLTFSVSATDADLPANALTFSMANAPAGMTIDPSTGAVSWTPTEAQGPSVVTVTFIVTDNGSPALSDQKTVQITVNEVNVAPVLSDVPASATIPELVPYTFTAKATDADLPAQTLTFSLVSGPAGASINSSTGVFTWTPTEAQGPGTYPFSVKVSDGVTSTSQSITLTVAEVNVAPVITVPGSKTVEWGNLLTFSVSGSDSDYPANTLAYSISSGSMAGMSVNPTTGVFTWTPTNSQIGGPYTVTFRATDNGSPALSDDKSVLITVTKATTNGSLNGETDQGLNVGGVLVAGVPTLSFASLVGQAVNIKAFINAKSGVLPQGTVTLYLTDSTFNKSAPLATIPLTVTDGVASTGPLNLPTLDPGNHYLAFTYNGDSNYNSFDPPMTWGIAKAETATAVTGTGVVVYGVPTTFTATVTDTDPYISFNGLGNLPAGYATAKPEGTVSFYANGSATPFYTGTVDAINNGVITTPPQTWLVGTYNVVAKYSGGTCYTASNSTAFTTVITPTEGTVGYIGQTYFVTSGSSSTTVQVNLSASVWGPNINPGNIATAIASFWDITPGGPVGGTLLAGNVPVSPVAGQPGTGTANKIVTLSTGQYGFQDYLIEVRLSGCYKNTQQTGADPTSQAYLAAHPTISVSQPDATNTLHGSGNIAALSTAAGTYGVGITSPIHFNVGLEYTNKGTNLKGQVILWYTRADGVYCIKSNAISSMSVKSNSSGPIAATVYTKANISRTNSSGTVGLEGNVTLRIDVVDGKVPGNGTGDQIAITVLSSKDSTLYLSNDWQWDALTKAYRSMLEGLDNPATTVGIKLN